MADSRGQNDIEYNKVVSEINNDKAVLVAGRKSKLTGDDVKASLRDQQVKKLKVKLEDMDVGMKVVNLWYTGNARRAEWLERQQSFLREYDEFLNPIYPTTMEWQSSLHLPIGFTMAKTVHARYVAALMDIDPPFTAKARKEANTQRAPLVQELMRYCLRDWCNRYQGVGETIDTFVWQWVTAGTAILKGGWEKRYEKFMDVIKQPKPGPPQFQPQPDGTLKAVPTTVQEDVEQEQTIELVNCPLIEHVNIEDVVIVGGLGDPQQADAVLHSQWLTADDLYQLVDQGIFDEEAVKLTIEGGDNQKAADQTGRLKQMRAESSGNAQLDSPHDLRRYQILEAYIKLDVHGGGINTDVIVWVHKVTRAVLRATYLRRVSPNGMRPFFKADFHKRKDQDYGAGLIELTYSLCKEIDAMHNLKMDFGILSSLPFGYYKPQSSLQTDKMPLEPGTLMPLDNPGSDVFFPNLGNRTAFGFQEEASLYSYLERLTSISDLSLGLLSAQGAARTATGARALVGEANANLNIFLQRVHKPFKQMLHYLFAQLQQKLPDGFEFRITGEDGREYFHTVKTRYEISGMYDFELEPNTANSNKQVQVEQANQIYQLTSNPLDLQLGIITPSERFESIKNLLQTLGIKDWSRFARKPANAARAFTPEEMANRVLSGTEVPMDPTQDLQGFLDYVAYIFQHDELLGQFNEDQARALGKKSIEAQQMLKAMQAAAAQQRNQQQMQMNATQSAQQAPTGGSPTPQQAQPMSIGPQGAGEMPNAPQY